MRTSKQQIDTALLALGSERLEKLWGVTATEVSRRINGERNIPIADLAAALDEAGAQIVPPHEDVVIVPRRQYEAVRILARESSILRDDGGE